MTCRLTEWNSYDSKSSYDFLQFLLSKL
jgi:hypothetical protein